MTHIIWFRNNLRVTDNQAVREACNTEGTVIAVYCFDPRHYLETKFGFPKTGAFRAKFLMETVSDLQKNLAGLNIPLFIFRATPESVFIKLTEEFHIKSIHTQAEWTRDETIVSDAVKKVIPADIKWCEYYDQFLFQPADIPYESFQKLPKVFTDFRKKCEKYAEVEETLPIPKKKHPSNLKLTTRSETKLPTLEKLNLTTPVFDKRTAFPFQGGEFTGKKRLQDYIWDTQNIATYKQTRNGLIGTAYSSKFSAWLANGSLSPRMIYWEVKKFERDVKKNQDTYWMIFELIWRDFFKYVSLKHGNSLFKLGGILDKPYDWGTSEKVKERWIKGETKYPFVNAHMKEIAATGWMSNRGRQNVASFWAKELKQDWRIGASYFESQLIDYDVHSNWGNWQYVSGVGNDSRDRKFNIEKQTENYDSNGDFRNLWLH